MMPDTFFKKSCVACVNIVNPKVSKTPQKFHHCRLPLTDLLGVDAAVVGHIPLAPLVHVQLAHGALEALFGDA